MDNLREDPSANFDAPSSPSTNQLWQYVQSMDESSVGRLSKPESEEVKQVMERHILSLLGNLPSEQFDVMVSTSREHLAHLMSVAMLNGYFLRAAEQRLAVERLVQSDLAVD
ncbi:hypothetical protein C1752_01777 [Acaryochloris thomasi RCC1774]|uniref:DUF760 domain-containing protein n=1 Tax=Acaryochloris thomasi RCC1774 TaxID=1764569 RepID=A0A2W1JLD9_9CYAN|nr:DUF760 domain-containing protein [Acaryochloris thomasi]PZD74006.1 hypothetical protein C1752_01777 [Acaryochloris thomasi RCC1774]